MKRPINVTEKSFSTRKDAAAVVSTLLEACLPFYSEGKARLRLGETAAHYEVRAQEMEAWARPLWGIVPLLLGAEEKDSAWVERIRTGLINGTDPAHPEYWGLCHDFDQKFCEMPAIAMLLLYLPDQFLAPLDRAEREKLSDWMNEVNRHACCACNWQLFLILTNLGLMRSGLPYDREKLETGLQMIDDYYDAGGWYKDGNGGDKDYYNPFVMLSFGLLYREFMKEEDPERCQRFYDRAMAFGKDYQYFFAPDGSCFPYGRSMTYRFAQIAFYSVCVLCHVYPLPLPVMKGMIARHLADWLNRPIYDNAGILSIGYRYPNLQMSESYNAPGSPYWALQGFLFLGLPEEDAFWSAELQPMPVIEKLRYLPNVPMLIQRDASQTVALVPGKSDMEGHSHTIEKYSKFAYSSAFGFSIAKSQYSLNELAPDQTMVFRVFGQYYVKNQTLPGAEVTEAGIRMEWTPFPGIAVKTRLTPTDTGHIRTHEVRIAEKLLQENGGAIEAWDCGFAVPIDVFSSSTLFCSVSSQDVPGRDAADRPDRENVIIRPDPNTNLMVPKTEIPAVHYSFRSENSTVQTVLRYLA